MVVRDNGLAISQSGYANLGTPSGAQGVAFGFLLMGCTFDAIAAMVVALPAPE